MRLVRVLIIIVVILIISAINLQSNPTESINNWKKLSEQGSIYLTLAKDLMEMAKASSGNDIEFQIEYELSILAAEANDVFEAASDLLWIYEQISNPIDRIAVKIYINKRVNDYTSRLDFLIKQVNTRLSYSKSPGVAANGLRLKDELRSGQNLLKSAVIK